MRRSSIHWTDRLTYLVCRVLNRMGMRHKYAGRFTAAERAYRGAMALALTRRTPDAAVLADLYHNLGGLEHARRRFAAAEPLALVRSNCARFPSVSTTPPSPPTALR